jgi:hypothetical protein
MKMAVHPGVDNIIHAMAIKKATSELEKNAITYIAKTNSHVLVES